MGFPIVKTTVEFANEIATMIATVAVVSKLSAAKAGLGTGIFTPGPGTVEADCVEATYTGYAQSATIAWGAAINELDGSETTMSPSKLWRCTAGGSPQSITNLFITDGVASPGSGVLGVAIITPSIPIVNAGDGFSTIIAWNTGYTPGNSEVTVIQ